MKLICSLFITFLKIGAFTFGGGYAMIALLENEFVEKKKWLEKSEFLDMVAVAESTPGPVAINSATYIGYKIAGFAGATMSTLAVCIPSFFVIYGISLFFDQFLSLRWVSCAIDLKTGLPPYVQIRNIFLLSVRLTDANLSTD
jgi:chromate transporter